MLVKWDSSFSVKNDAMDRQHQHLFELLNQLHDAMIQGKSKNTLPDVFEKLVQYTKNHFSDEETLMKKHNYPGFVVHKRQHDDLIRQVTELKDQFQAGDYSVSMKTRDFLKEWLVEHIQGTDQKYGVYLKQRGLS